jgi:hypothetical protein
MANGDEYTRGDAVRIYLTGASTDGGAQADPDLSLGNHRSSTEIQQLAWRPYSMIPGIRIEQVSGATGEGDVRMQATGASALRMASPSGTVGSSISIANGETKVLQSGANSPAWCRVLRTSATDLTGDMSMLLAQWTNNVFGMGDLTNAQRAAGVDRCRCVCLKNESAYPVVLLYAWIDSYTSAEVTDTDHLPASGAGSLQTGAYYDLWDLTGYARIQQADGTLREIVYYTMDERDKSALVVAAGHRGLLGTVASEGAVNDTVRQVPGLRIAWEAPTGDHATTSANENDFSGISGLSWSSAITEATGLSLATLAAGGLYYLWFWLSVPAAAQGHWGLRNQVRLSWGAV